MFTAFDKSNTLIFADELIPAKSNKFYCPACNEMVFLKKGHQKTPHFAHYANSKCQSFSEGETEEHLVGKRMLYNILQKRNEEVIIEPFLKELSQRPDLLWLTKEGRKIAVEFQCSSLSVKRMLERTRGYYSQAIEVIWIVGRKFHLKDKLTPFHKLMLTEKYFNYPTLIQLSVVREELQLMKNIHLNLHNQYEFEKEVISLNAEKNLQVQSYQTTISSLKSFKFKHYNLERAIRFKNKDYQNFFLLLYKQNESIVTIPIEIYQSVGLEWLVRTNTFEWKYRLVLWLENLKEGSVITLKSLAHWVKSQIEKKTIVLYDTPMLSSETRLKPFVQFLDLLTKYGGLKKTGKTKWTYKHPLTRFEYLEQKKNILK